MAAESRRLEGDAAAAAKDPRGSGMREARRKLPAFSQRQDVLDRLHSRTVLVVSGATGPSPVFAAAAAGAELPLLFRTATAGLITSECSSPIPLYCRGGLLQGLGLELQYAPIRTPHTAR